MDETVKVILIGAKDSGKIWVLNNFFATDNNASKKDVYVDRGHDLSTCLTTRNDVGGTTFYMVTPPDITGSNDELSSKSWHDLIIAQDFCNDYISVFIIVLNVTHSGTGKKIVENFQSVFGEKARANCIVVYTNIPKPIHGNLDREIECQFDFVDQALTKGYPVVKLTKDDDNKSEMQTLRKHVTRIAGGSKYTVAFFKHAQLALLERWVAGRIELTSPNSDSEELMTTLDIPKDLMWKCFRNDRNFYDEALALMRGQRH